MLEGLEKPHPDADHPWRTGKAWTTTMQLQDAKLAGSRCNSRLGMLEGLEKPHPDAEQGGSSGGS
jgi:hypothetical protein